MTNRITTNRWISSMTNEEDVLSRQEYIAAHPEFHLIIMLFKIAVLKQHPEDISKFACEEFFNEKNRPVLEAILREKLYQDSKSRRRTKNSNKSLI